MTVGVLALQGSFNEHIAALRRLGVQGIEIRKAEQLLTVSSLIIPGGESTTMAKLAEYHNLVLSLSLSLQNLTSSNRRPGIRHSIFESLRLGRSSQSITSSFLASRIP
ncbi:hypothetical protein F2Q69_00044283 [Brassica cretica]|uniref:glutaminase n=1 Tax=Brassica cretica TaxID=69181 RepID=A0A8S9NHN5_BRACR|nr:hypothetical protein F2Q69_00044283 [Brassica cretica]